MIPVLLLRTLVAATASLCLLAHASKPGSDTGAQRKSTSVTFHKSPSEESPAAREKRLKRECKGRANAGMCLGHTR
ncbi:MAG: hypothetical protein Q8N06_07760 [Hydrogenophaga sp.]|nr:hypothetical protein [Hydrogenophaga sp.]MDP2015224.1 hypothetical protein [Hydrogenophaga sp.]MDP3165333.1 hypothetical protein [Hydrogenophaga sp.]MDP3810457.1 hypothetical protein [Hydrogenophaga sp.]